MEEDITPFSTRRLTFGKFGNRSLPFIEWRAMRAPGSLEEKEF